MMNLNDINIKFKNFIRGGLDKSIFFMHIPKCGGSSVGHAIRRMYFTINLQKYYHNLANLHAAASLNVATIFDYPLFKFRENLLLYYMSQDNIKYISGHFNFSKKAYQKYGSRFTFITILRNPVKRWISHYFYDKYKKSNHFKIESDFDTFLKSDRGRESGNTYVSWLCGNDTFSNYRSSAAINQAKENLNKFGIVGALEHLEIFCKQFENVFGVPLKTKKNNINPVSNSFKRSVINAEAEKKINEICQPDIEIYEYALNNHIKLNDF